MRTTSPLVLLALLFGLSAAGCSDSAAEGVVVGEVYLDNGPLPKGLVRFVPTDDKLAPKDAEVVNGKFELKIAPCDAKVEIMAPKVIGKRKMYATPDSPEVEDIAELLPARFNTQSTLKMTVTAGRQEKRFDVQSK